MEISLDQNGRVGVLVNATTDMTQLGNMFGSNECTGFKCCVLEKYLLEPKSIIYDRKGARYAGRKYVSNPSAGTATAVTGCSTTVELSMRLLLDTMVTWCKVETQLGAVLDFPDSLDPATQLLHPRSPYPP